MSRKGQLICFIGIDGAGKTTLAKRMDSAFKDQGLNSQYVYGRVTPFISRLFMGLGRVLLLRRKKGDLFSDYNAYTTQKQKILKNGYISRIYTWSLLTDQVIQANMRLRFKLLSGKTLFCDRYVFDTVITDIVPNLQISPEDAMSLISRLLNIMPEPDLIFLIDLPSEIAYSRKNDVPHISYLSERRELYCLLREKFDTKIIVLDGSNTPDVIFEQSSAAIRTILGEESNV
jgi:thymidylate kinase